MGKGEDHPLIPGTIGKHWCRRVLDEPKTIMLSLLTPRVQVGIHNNEDEVHDTVVSGYLISTEPMSVDIDKQTGRKQYLNEYLILREFVGPFEDFLRSGLVLRKES